MHRGHRIVALKLGATWDAIVYDPDSHIVASDIEGETAGRFSPRSPRSRAA